MSTVVNYIKGNIFTSSHQTLVNTVNCVGIMGAGIALEFKYRYPDMFDRYVKLCQEGKLVIGSLWIYDVPDSNTKILNFPTKDHWKADSKIEFLQKGLDKFLETYSDRKITSAAFPLLGAQNGGLDPEQVKSIMTEYLSKCDIPITIYEYDPGASDDLFDVFSKGIFYNRNEFERTTGLPSKSIDKLKSLLSNDGFNSLIQLTKVKGIGDETIKACYRFAMKFRHSLVTTQEIFGQLQEPESPNYVVPKKRPAKSRRPKTPKGPLSIEQKQLYTSLSQVIISKIESGDESVTISEIKDYCTGLGKDFKKFIAAQYTPQKSNANLP